MELPNYNRQLMQQLHALRKEGQFCDCTILVGDIPHRAHKLVLAASSLLFKSLLESSDSVSIDPALVTSQEFSSLLEMAYTGRLPPGKHNFTRVIAAADSLQMFDVAIGCKNILASLMRQPATAPAPPLVKMQPTSTGNQGASPAVSDPNQRQNPGILEALAQRELGVVESEVQGAVKVSQQVEQMLSSPPQDSFSEAAHQKATEKAGLQDSSENLELLTQSQDKIARIIGDVQLWVKAAEMWEGIPGVEKKVILECCRGGCPGPSAFHRLLHSVTEGGGLSAHTLFLLLSLLREHRPELGAVLEGQAGHQEEEDTTIKDSDVIDQERPGCGSVLLEHVEELAATLADMESLGDRLTAAAGRCAGGRITEVKVTWHEPATSLAQYRSGSETPSVPCPRWCLSAAEVGPPREVATCLLAAVGQAEAGLTEGDLMLLLQELQDSSPKLQGLLACIWPQEDPTGDQEESDGSELLRRYRRRLLQTVSDPQLLLHSLETMMGFLAEERERVKDLLQQPSSVQCLDGLLSEALEGSRLSSLSVWRLLFRAAAQDASLELLIQEVREQPGAQRLIQGAMDPESLHVDLLLKHKTLILQVPGQLATLEAGLRAAEDPPEEIPEFLSACGSQEGSLSVGDVLVRVLEQKQLCAQTFCRLLSLNRQGLPLLEPLFQDLERAGEEAELKDAADPSQEAESQAGDVQQPKAGRKRAAAKQCFCQWCGKAFAFRCRMEVHRKRCRLSQEASQRCPRCALELATPHALQQHLAEAHEDQPRRKRRKQESVSCDLCGKTFAHPSGMLYHKRTDHFDEKPYACKECGAKFAANSSLKNHQRLHTGERPFRCRHCDMSFSQAAALSYHTKKKHSEGKMYACQYCEALFAQSIELTRHVRTHTGDKPYVCRECGKGFSQANGLSVHLHTFHNIADPHDCQKCRMSFSSLEEHRKHIQECHPKEYHRCDMCNKIFNSAALLEKHMVSHVGGKPYSCKICHKAYQQLSGLWYHNRTAHLDVLGAQSGRGPKSLFQCPACSRAFSSSTSLLKHQRAEHPEGVLECEECKDTFPDLDNLLAHKKEKHSEFHQCPYCPSSYTLAADLQQHLCAQHFSQEGELFGCAHCDLLFPSQLELQEHFLSHHTEALSDESQVSATQMVIQAEEAPGGQQQVIALDQSQLSGSQVYVALTDTEGGAAGSEIVAVNMEDLLDGTVTFICGESQ
ncbi:LOW QUALITY PROTEIN: zinc finger and BTB domain-containing protein 40 [Brienomyrus brachyistius]|uniref:LOW QUALITY PROTEIN: zinc finger and BTB domain-containing protein 40 n=1 Tax=Brienomyrus brachyistius TaxID=42636 RepID=UPI0020B443FF|nr:LOW QUALITY PROTEIN: zinc finger and BTB domain-containing protein 40 [Brienomyrus brachyistius]